MNKKIFISLLVLSLANVNFANAKKSRVEFVGKVSGVAKINSKTDRTKISTVTIVVDRLSNELIDDLNNGDVLEAWLIDEGRASTVLTTSADPSDAVSDDERPFGDTGITPIGSSVTDANGSAIAIANVPFINLVEAAPFAVSIGTLKKNKNGNYVGKFKVRNNFNSFDSLMITRERGNDPRPGGRVGFVNQLF